MQLGESYAVVPRGPITNTLELPGSKSHSNRALLIAALAQGTTFLSNLLVCDDTVVMRRAAEAFGAIITESALGWTIQGVGGKPRSPGGNLDVGASGTAARFLTGALTLVDGVNVLDGVPRMRERPILPLLETLRQLGADVADVAGTGCPPVRVAGGSLRGGAAEIDARDSSQYVSAVLLISPYASTDVVLSLRDGRLVSAPYLDVTLDMMRDFGAEVLEERPRVYRITAGSGYQGRAYTVEPDASTAAFFLVATAICGGRIEVAGLPGTSKQADLGALSVLESMGCPVERGSDRIVLQAASKLRGVDVDMSSMPDAVPAISVAALFAEGPTTIRNVANLRLKETDRIAALETELRSMGAQVQATADSLCISPGELRPATIETYHDHRIAMAFTLAGLRVPGVVILNPGCVSKSFPEFFEVIESL